MEKNYNEIVNRNADHVFEVMAKRASEDEIKQLHAAFELAKEAHSKQRRKSGEPYIIHPIAVATIAAEELNLDVHSVMAAFLHDVVEDTEYTIEDMKKFFGDDVAFLVDVVTKKKSKNYKRSKQVDNYQQLLDSLSYDIRALMIKIADRLHNMRTLASMRPDKQMKIAGETDYFYAPLANRLGLYDVKTDLENLSFKFRCGMQYADIKREMTLAKMENQVRLDTFTRNVVKVLGKNGIKVTANVYWRQPYSIWRRMQAQEKDFRHIENPYYIRVTFDHNLYPNTSEKNLCLQIYSILTDTYKERPASFCNLIDIAKENSYKSINVMLLSDGGIWEDVQICSDHMVETSRLGCMADVEQNNVREWIKKFKMILKDIATQSHEQAFIEKVVTSLYYDDVMALSPDGNGIILPKGATALDFAFELHTDIGLHAKYARINGKLKSIKTPLHRGDCVEIGTDPLSFPKHDWMESVCTYKSKKALNSYFAAEQSQRKFTRCPHCMPLPGGETIGFVVDDGVVMHRRNCQLAIEQASKNGDSIIDIEFPVKESVTYPITIHIKAVDRYHLLIDIVDMITNVLKLSIESLHTITQDDIADCKVTFYVHSVKELVASMASLYRVEGVDEVVQITTEIV